MTRSKGPRRITIGSRAVAVGVICDFLQNLGGRGLDDPELARDLAEEFVDQAWDVEYKPTAERLVITIDAGVTSGDRMRSTPEDQPPEVGPASTA